MDQSTLSGLEMLKAPRPLDRSADGEVIRRRVSQLLLELEAGGLEAIPWNAGTTIIDEQGWVLATQPGVGPAAADVDLARARSKHLGGLCDAFADRRPELYGAVVRAGG